MPSTNTANNPLLSLAQSMAKAPAANRNEENSSQLFESSLNRSIQTQQNEQLARAATPARQEASASKPSQPEKPSEPTKAEQAKPAEEGKKPEEGKKTEEGKQVDEAKGASKDAAGESKDVKDKVPDDKGEDDKDAAATGDAAQQAAAAMAAMLAQLQAVAEPDVTPTGEGSLTAELGDALQSDAKPFSLADLTAKLASGRQALPLDAAGADKKALLGGDTSAELLIGQGKGELGKELLAANTQAGAENFAQLLDQRVQSGAAVAGQQVMTPVARMDSGRAQTLEQVRSTFSIQHPVGGEGWDKALGNKVIMMVSNQNQEVEMHLNPPHLGPMEVKLSLNQDQATLTFVAAQQPVRDALQASLPKLSEMLAESGIQLAQANVQSQSNQDSQGREQSSGRGAGRGRVDSVDETQNQPASWRVRAPLGLPGNVNLFV